MIDNTTQMLQGAPWLLAHKSMLKTNKPHKISLYGQDYVMWKDKQENIQALPNICPHMGAMLSEGWCEVNSDGISEVVCPFHALKFDSDGRTVLPGTDKKTLPQMRPLKLIIKDDFIWSYKFSMTYIFSRVYLEEGSTIRNHHIIYIIVTIVYLLYYIILL